MKVLILCFFTQKTQNTHSFCDYLDELQSRCFSLYSSCYPTMAMQMMLKVWVRQELKKSLSVLPRNQFFRYNTTKEILHEKELDVMQEMVKVKDWFANSRLEIKIMTQTVRQETNIWH